MDDDAIGQFQSALRTLRVQKESEPDDNLVASLSIDLSNLPDAGNRRILIRLDSDGHLHVDSPPGAVSTSSAGCYKSAPTSYEWGRLGGAVPNPNGFKPPTVRNAGSGARKERLLTRPVHAALERIARDAELWAAGADGLTKMTADGLWKDVWAEIGPHLHPDALAVAARHDLDFQQYRLLANRPDLRRIAERAPGVASRLRPLPIGTGVRNAIPDLLEFEDVIARGENHTYGYEAGFQAWARTVPPGKNLLPATDRLADHQRYDRTEGLMRHVARTARDGHVDPNQVRKIEGRTGWMLFHSAAAHSASGYLVPKVLRDPAAAARNVDRHFPARRKGEGVADRMARALHEIEQWRQHAWSAAFASERWAERLDDPSVAFDDPAKRVRGFGRLCRETSGLRNKVARARRLCEDPVGIRCLDTLFAMFAPRGAIRAVIQHPEFDWDMGALAHLTAQDHLRLDPGIRPSLIDRARTPEMVSTLLADGHASETKALWGRLARRNPTMALEYLEDHGFDPAVQWSPPDMAPLVTAGGETALRAISLASRLSQSETRVAGTAQGDLFGPATPTPRSGVRR